MIWSNIFWTLSKVALNASMPAWILLPNCNIHVPTCSKAGLILTKRSFNVVLTFSTTVWSTLWTALMIRGVNDSRDVWFVPFAFCCFCNNAMPAGPCCNKAISGELSMVASVVLPTSDKIPSRASWTNDTCATPSSNIFETLTICSSSSISKDLATPTPTFDQPLVEWPNSFITVAVLKLPTRTQIWLITTEKTNTKVHHGNCGCRKFSTAIAKRKQVRSTTAGRVSLERDPRWERA
mmetsp:Transcript_11432/g.32239  ORF Transcript_11432/g.32239 Transcript_11432/m.32239 type:complete len:237 (-) Transcript_11432:9-719(-)